MRRVAKPAATFVVPFVALAACAGSPPPSPPEPPAKRPSEAPPSATPPPVPGPAAAAPVSLQRLANGVTVFLRQAPAGRLVRLQANLQAGALAQAPGLAELTAHVLAETADPARGRGSLRQVVEGLGGSLQLQVGADSTTFDVRVPRTRWLEAATALAAALTTAPASRSQVERVRSLCLQREAAAIDREPVVALARLLLRGTNDTSRQLGELQDRDASEVAAFHARHYRPESLRVQVESDLDPDAVLAALRSGGAVDLERWKPPSAAAPAARRSRTDESLVYWTADAAGRCDVGLLLELPPTAKASAAAYVLQDCLTLDGTGGRLERFQQQFGIGHVRWRAVVVDAGDTSALLLRAELDAAEAALAWRCLQLARESLRDVPPTSSELELAARRAPLTARLPLLDPGSRLRAELRLAERGETLRDLDAALQARGAAAPTNDEVTAFLATPVAMIVVGGTAPTDLAPLQRWRVLPPGFESPEAATATRERTAAERAASGAPWLAHAIDAVGGADRLRRLDGWTSLAELSHAEAPPVRESVDWFLDGRLVRRRELLGQTIVTTVEGERGTETLSGTTVALSAGELQQLRDEPARHPLAILAAHLRGELPFEYVAKRAVEDREHVVLQALGSRSDRLRVHVDADSHLVRRVELWATLPDGSVVRIEEAWGDYRTVAGLRVPHLRLVDQDEGKNRLEAVFVSFVPRLRAP